MKVNYKLIYIFEEIIDKELCSKIQRIFDSELKKLNDLNKEQDIYADFDHKILSPSIIMQFSEYYKQLKTQVSSKKLANFRT